LIVTPGVLLFITGMNIMAVVASCFFKYNLKAEQIIPMAFPALFVSAADSITLFVLISNKKEQAVQLSP